MAGDDDGTDVYEAGDVNMVAAQSDGADDDGYEPGDVNTFGSAGRGAAGRGGVGSGDPGRPGGGDTGAGSGGAGSGAGENVTEAGAPAMPTEVLTFIARSLVDDPDAVRVEAEERRGAVRLHLSVGSGDMGRVIGRRGRTAQAIRTVVAVAGAVSGTQTSVDIVDD